MNKNRNSGKLSSTIMIIFVLFMVFTVYILIFKKGGRYNGYTVTNTTASATPKPSSTLSPLENGNGLHVRRTESGGYVITYDNGIYRSSSTPNPQATLKPQATQKPSTGKRKSVSPTPDVKGYYHPDDFYYDHRDDFIDYEDAEDWYYEHGGY